ncbi:MAG: MFS transporter [Promethearchaeota archaeon]
MDTKTSGNSELKNSTRLSHKEKLKKYNINQKYALFTILLTIFIDVLGYSMLMPLLPTIVTQTFGASSFTVGLMIASNALAAFMVAPLWGKISDKIGRKLPLIISQIGTLASFMILGLSDSIPFIFLSRIFDGIMSGQMPIIRAYILDITDEKTRSAEMGKFTAGMSFGMIFGPSIGGLLGVINWRLPAFIASILATISIIFVLKFLTESMPHERRLALKLKKRKNIDANNGVKETVFTKVVLFRLFQLFIIAIAFTMIFSTFALVMNLRYNFDVGMIGLFATFAGIIMMIIGGVLMKVLIKKFGEKKMLLFSIGLGIFSFMSYPFLYEAWILFIYIIPFIFMNIFIRSIIQTNLSKSVDEDKQGIVSGWATNMFSIGQIIAPLLGYWYLDIGEIMIVGLIFDAYFLIGITCTFFSIILLILVLIDIKKNKNILWSNEKLILK